MFTPLPETPSKLDSILYFTSVSIGAYRFSAIIQRRVKEDILIAPDRRATFGTPIRLETYVVPASEEYEPIADDYSRILKELSTSQTVLGLGNFEEFYRANLHLESNSPL